MNKSILHDLYFGRLVPWEWDHTQAPGYTTLAEKVSQIGDYFEDRLSSEEYEKLEKLQDLEAELGEIANEDFFQYGLCMGILIMTEVFRFRDERLAGRD